MEYFSIVKTIEHVGKWENGVQKYKNGETNSNKTFNSLFICENVAFVSEVPLRCCLDTRLRKDISGMAP